MSAIWKYLLFVYLLEIILRLLLLILLSLFGKTQTEYEHRPVHHLYHYHRHPIHHVVHHSRPEYHILHHRRHPSEEHKVVHHHQHPVHHAVHHRHEPAPVEQPMKPIHQDFYFVEGGEERHRVHHRKVQLQSQAPPIINRIRNIIEETKKPSSSNTHYTIRQKSESNKSKSKK